MQERGECKCAHSLIKGTVTTVVIKFVLKPHHPSVEL